MNVNMEEKKEALIRILQILLNNTDSTHLLTQDELVKILNDKYQISIERKAVGRNVNVLKKIGYDIVVNRRGTYLNSRWFEDAELRLIIDSIISSNHISNAQSQSLIKRLSSLSTKYFKSNIEHIYKVSNLPNKTENQEVFYNIETISEAIDKKKMVEYEYFKYGVNKSMKKSSFQRLSPYLLISHNQRYYIMGFSSYWGKMAFHRLDHIKNIRVSDRDIVPIEEVEGYENGIRYRDLATSLPYMFVDDVIEVTFETDENTIDQVIDWFGKDISIVQKDEKVLVTLKSSKKAMLYWASQYANVIKIISPLDLKEEIIEYFENAINKYKGETNENQ